MVQQMMTSNVVQRNLRDSKFAMTIGQLLKGMPHSLLLHRGHHAQKYKPRNSNDGEPAINWRDEKIYIEWFAAIFHHVRAEDAEQLAASLDEILSSLEPQQAGEEAWITLLKLQLIRHRYGAYLPKDSSFSER
jgi:hypothetical protein